MPAGQGKAAVERRNVREIAGSSERRASVRYERSKQGIATRTERSEATNGAPGLSTRNKKLLVTSASLLVTSALLVVTRSY